MNGAARRPGSNRVRAIAWLVAVGAGLLAARLLGLVELAALSFAVLATLAIDGAWLMLDLRRRPLAVARIPVDAVPAGVAAHAEIEVSNPGTGRSSHPCEVHWHNTARTPTDDLAAVNRGVVGVGIVHPGDRLVLTHQLDTRLRGETSIAGTHLLARSPMSVWSVRFEIEPPGSVLIWPRLHPLTGDGAPPTQGLSAEHTQIAVLNEPDGELAGLRPYVRGDDIRMIHWRTSARRDQPHVVQKEPPRTPDGVRVWLDTTIAPSAEATAHRDFERSLSVAASVISHFGSRDLRAELLTPTEHLVGEPRDLLNHLALLQPSTGRADPPADREVDLAISSSSSSAVPKGCPTIACWAPLPPEAQQVPPDNSPIRPAGSEPLGPEPDHMTVHWLEGEPLSETWRRLLDLADRADERAIRSLT